jgi:hypothetical protein
MKKFLFAISIAMAFLTMQPAIAAEMQKVCIDKITKDGKPVIGKDGKPQQECKNMKVHKKLEGTAVPVKK